MLFRTFDQFQVDPLGAILTLLGFLVALAVGITFHEFNHAFIATRLGDSLPRRQGRLSLDPLAHLDPAGTIMIFIVGFGWGKPVMVDQRALRLGPRSGMALVSLGGPLANIIVAFVAAIPIKLGLVSPSVVSFRNFQGGADDVLPYLLGLTIALNLVLAAFNLLPIAPLDGFKVALGILPRSLAEPFSRLERYGPIILLSLILF
ncbi:MAG: site-2 protease family protein, partial [Chloroflexi bacterium]|nr:site-2 protease family protein [Chloroflexota bacterium]